MTDATQTAPAKVLASIVRMMAGPLPENIKNTIKNASDNMLIILLTKLNGDVANMAMRAAKEAPGSVVNAAISFAKAKMAFEAVVDEVASRLYANANAATPADDDSGFYDASSPCNCETCTAAREDKRKASAMTADQAFAKLQEAAAQMDQSDGTAADMAKKFAPVNVATVGQQSGVTANRFTLEEANRHE